LTKEELKPGLVIFHRGDLGKRHWYCRVRLTQGDKYKTVFLKTADINQARSMTFDQDAELRFMIKHTTTTLSAGWTLKLFLISR
jgi:integrase